MSKSNPRNNNPAETDSTAAAETTAATTSSTASTTTTATPLDEDLLRRTELMSLVKTDDSLTPDEKETVIREAKSDDGFRFCTERAPFTRGAIEHPEINITTLIIRDHDGNQTQREFTDSLSADDITGHIVGARGTIPIGLLAITASARDNDRLGNIFDAGHH